MGEIIKSNGSVLSKIESDLLTIRSARPEELLDHTERMKVFPISFEQQGDAGHMGYLNLIGKYNDEIGLHIKMRWKESFIGSEFYFDKPRIIPISEFSPTSFLPEEGKYKTGDTREFKWYTSSSLKESEKEYQTSQFQLVFQSINLKQTLYVARMIGYTPYKILQTLNNWYNAHLILAKTDEEISTIPHIKDPLGLLIELNSENVTDANEKGKDNRLVTVRRVEPSKTSISDIVTSTELQIGNKKIPSIITSEVKDDAIYFALYVPIKGN